MTIAGIDFSSFQVDVAILSEDDDTATHHEFKFGKKDQDAFDRARCIREIMPTRTWWEAQGVIAVGIEDPRGPHRNVDSVIYRVQGAILACIPPELMVKPWKPQEWRKQIGVSHKGKESLYEFAVARWPESRYSYTADGLIDGLVEPSQDCCDAYCMAYATRMQIQFAEAA